MDTASLGVAVRVDRLGAELSRAASGALERLDVSLWEYDVLSTLRRQPSPFELPATAIANETCMTSGAITHRVTQLVKRGLATREPDESDRRTVRVRLTAEGIRLTDRALKIRIAAVTDSLQVLGDDERATLDRLLGKVLSGVESR